jgi:probable rRNA maturation factor
LTIERLTKYFAKHHQQLLHFKFDLAPLVSPQDTTQPPLTVTVSLQGSAVNQLQEIAPAEQWSVWCGQWLQLLAVTRSPIGAYELSLSLGNDDEIQALNRDYRHKDAPTDVLAFAALEAAMALPPDLLQSDPLYLGDIIVSLDTARRQSAAHGHTWQEEVLWLTAHGFLHLLGWDHPDEAALQRMWQQQQQLLAVVGMSLPTSAYAQAAG